MIGSRHAYLAVVVSLANRQIGSWLTDGNMEYVIETGVRLGVMEGSCDAEGRSHSDSGEYKEDGKFDLWTAVYFGRVYLL